MKRTRVYQSELKKYAILSAIASVAVLSSVKISRGAVPCRHYLEKAGDSLALEASLFASLPEEAKYPEAELQELERKKLDPRRPRAEFGSKAWTAAQNADRIAEEKIRKLPPALDQRFKAAALDLLLANRDELGWPFAGEEARAFVAAEPSQFEILKVLRHAPHEHYPYFSVT